LDETPQPVMGAAVLFLPAIAVRREVRALNLSFDGGWAEIKKTIWTVLGCQNN
jgi:hypothetical protein